MSLQLNKSDDYPHLPPLFCRKSTGNTLLCRRGDTALYQEEITMPRRKKSGKRKKVVNETLIRRKKAVNDKLIKKLIKKAVKGVKRQVEGRGKRRRSRSQGQLRGKPQGKGQGRRRGRQGRGRRKNFEMHEFNQVPLPLTFKHVI